MYIFLSPESNKMYTLYIISPVGQESSAAGGFQIGAVTALATAPHLLLVIPSKVEESLSSSITNWIILEIHNFYSRGRPKAG